MKLILTADGGMPVDVADGFLFAEVKVHEGLIFLQLRLCFPRQCAIVLTQRCPVITENIRDVILLQGDFKPARHQVSSQYINTQYRTKRLGGTNEMSCGTSEMSSFYLISTDVMKFFRFSDRR